MKKQQLVYLARIEHEGEFAYAILSFIEGKLIEEYSVKYPPVSSNEETNKLLRDFGAAVRKMFVTKDQDLLFGKEPPVSAAVSFGKQLRQFFPLPKTEQSLFFEGFSI